MKIAIVTLFLAPYRVNLYSSLSEQIGKNGEVRVFFGQKLQPDHNWSDLGEDAKCSMEYRPGKHLPRWVQKILRTLKIGKGNPMLSNKKLKKSLEKYDPDVVVICEHNIYTLPASLYCICSGKPLWVATEIGASAANEDASFIVKAINSVGNLYVDGILACSPHAVKPLFGPRRPILMTPHAVSSRDYSMFRADFDSTKPMPVLLFVGNCIPRKGIDLLLEALAIVKQSGVSCLLRILGGGDHEWVERMVAKFDLADRVDLVGFAEGEELKQHYKNADMFILPSRSDTYGVVAHEAAVCGLPVLVSKYAGSSKLLVDHGKNGYVIDPINVEKMASYIIELSRSLELRKEFGKYSLEKVDIWDIDKTAERILTEFERIV